MVIAVSGPQEIPAASSHVETVPTSVIGARAASARHAATDAGPRAMAFDRPDTEGTIRELVAAQEFERRRIARDLHDVVGQALTAVRLNLEHLRRDAATVRTDADLRRSIAIVDQAMRDVRDIAFDLRPAILDDLGLVSAARWYTSRQARFGGYRATFRATPLAGSIGVEVEAACFRTLQEALTNVARHARATRVQVALRQTCEDLTLSVQDDGVGFDTDRVRASGRHPTFGLIGASERVALVGGTFDIASRPGEGTRVVARFPRRDGPVGHELDR